MHLLLVIVLYALFATFIDIAVTALLKRISFGKAAKALITKLTLEGSKLDADLLAKLHALENGGHLATGTTATVIAAQTATPTKSSTPTPTTPSA